MADHISAPKLGTLTQGTVFTCAAAEDYAGCIVYGLVITARCDVAQNKAAVFNYLPVVTLNDCVHRDGRILLCDRIAKNLLGRMRAALRSAKYSESIMLTQPPEAILDTLFSAASTSKSDQKARAAFQELARDYRQILETHESDPSELLARGVANKHSSDRDTLLRELVHHKLNGYYFLPSIAPNGSDQGYVVLLREIRHIPRDLAARIGDGISAEEYAALCAERPHFGSRLSFEREPFGMPIGLLASPYTEHLMQVFSMLFSRIGLPDPDQSYVESIWHRLPSAGGTE